MSAAFPKAASRGGSLEASAGAAKLHGSAAHWLAGARSGRVGVWTLTGRTGRHGAGLSAQQASKGRSMGTGACGSVERDMRSRARKPAWKGGLVTVVVRRYAYGPLVSVQLPPTTCPSTTGRRATDTLCAVVTRLSLCCRRSDKVLDRVVADRLVPVPSRGLWY